MLKHTMTALWQEGHQAPEGALAAAVIAHNTLANATLRMSPYEALFGRPPFLAHTGDYSLPVGENLRHEMLAYQTGQRSMNFQMELRQLEGLPSTLEEGDTVVVAKEDLGGHASQLMGTAPQPGIATPGHSRSAWSTLGTPTLRSGNHSPCTRKKSARSRPQRTPCSAG